MDNTLAGSITNYTNRPKQITLAIDKLLGPSGLNNYIDAEKIAVLGHSVGGYAAVAVAGGVGDTRSLIEICKNNPLLTDPYCASARDGSLAQTIIKGTKDTRIKAIILMAPVGILFSAEGALNDVDIPVLLLKAEKDEEVTEPYNADVIEKGLPNKQQLTSIMVSNAGHYSFLTSFPDFLKPEIGPIAEDPKGFNRADFQKKLGAMIVDYLKGVLK
jgi:predicted dienelactone hydrolase